MKLSRLAIVVSHPIQHFCPQYSSWASLPGLQIRVFFASQHGLKPYEDKNFARLVQWDALALDFPHEFLPGAETKALDNSIDAPMLEQRLSEFSPDVILVYGYSQPLQRRALKWARASTIRVLMIGDSELRAHRSLPRRVLKALLLPRIFRKVDRFLTVGDSNEAYYRTYGVPDDRLIRSFFPIDVKHYDQVLATRGEAREKVRAVHGIPSNHQVLLMVGKLASWKRQSDLVRFSNSIQATHSDVTVILVGSGPDETKLKTLTNRLGPGGVVFSGFVTPTNLSEYYCASDIYVHCSRHEPHSLAISEAIYCGLPIVVSDRCGSYGPTDDVRIGLNGLVYRCGDLAALRSVLSPLINSEDRRRSMGLASKEIATGNQKLANGRALLQALESMTF